MISFLLALLGFCDYFSFFSLNEALFSVVLFYLLWYSLCIGHKWLCFVSFRYVSRRICSTVNSEVMMCNWGELLFYVYLFEANLTANQNNNIGCCHKFERNFNFF